MSVKVGARLCGGYSYECRCIGVAKSNRQSPNMHPTPRALRHPENKGDAAMRKLSLLTLTLLLLSAWVVAQDSSQAGSSASAQSSSNGSQTTIEGCLSSSGGNYTLTDNSGKSYQLGDNTSKFSEHVGHQVQIKGTETGATASASTPSGATASANTGSSESNPSSSASQSGSTSSQSGSASAAVQFKVDSIKHVSSTCTTPSTNK